jgi:hypothetical protein
MRSIVALGIFLVANVGFSAPALKEIQKPASLDGIWIVAERHINGERDDSTSPIRWTICGESLTIEMKGRRGFVPVEGPSYGLVRPKGGRANEIDYVLTPKDTEVPPSLYRAVVEIDGDTLKFSMAHTPDEERPAKCLPAFATNFYILKRVKEDKEN